MSYQNNCDHAFMIEHVEFIGLNASIVYYQLSAPLKFAKNYTIDISMERLTKAMPYFSRAEIFACLKRLEDVSAIAMKQTEDGEDITRICLINPLEDIFDLKGE